MKKEINIEFKGVVYNSHLDEHQFFDWISKIGCLCEIHGEGDAIKATISLPVPDGDLREILALFFRYDVKCKEQLKLFLTDENAYWFKNNNHAYWYNDTFG